ncbi:MAG: mitochondrial fission ELM1 family protein [Luteolibacter sp.]
MVKKTRTLWMIGDGKPGHENQSLGLADAIARITPCQVHRISLAEVRGRIAHIRSAVQAGLALPPPDLILAAGHATHVPLVLLSRKFKAPSILLMRPSLPMQLFDLCVTPEHDFKAGYQRKKLLLTCGALNRVPPPSDAIRSGRMILIGGPSKLHGWDGEALLTALGKITASGSWQLTDSRRTPAGFTAEMRQHLPHLGIFPHEETGPHWLPSKLAAAEEVWVTEDSVSMVYESLSSGAKVGLLAVPRLKSGTRVLKGIEKLIDGGFITRFADWEKSPQLAAPPETLREADRCAAVIVERFGLAG